jgi:uncharacterized FlaG/YvyC family protein
MKVSNDKTVVLENKKLDYTPSVFEANTNNSVEKINKVNGVILNNNIPQKSPKELEELAKEINKLSEDKNVYVSFSADDKTGKNIIKFIDSSTKEIIKQIPSEEVLRVTQQIDKFLKAHSGSFPPGFFIDERI